MRIKRLHETLKEQNHSEDLGIDGKISELALKRMMMKESGLLLIWFRTGTSGGIL
jgi:hypothetical protein